MYSRPTSSGGKMLPTCFKPCFGHFLLMTVLLMTSTFLSCKTREPAWLNNEAAKREWRVYLGDQGSSHYSALAQINKENVAQLQVAWTYHTGDLPEGEYGEIQCNPIIVDGVLYGSSPRTKIFALHADSGVEIWEFDPFADRPEEANTQGRHRGVTYWQNEAGDDKRILFTAGAHLFAVDARNGKLIPSFGDSGKVRLNAGLDREL